MRVRSPLLPAVALSLGLLAGCAQTPPPQAGVSTPQELLIQQASIVLETFRNDTNMPDLTGSVRNAYAVVVVPQAIKAGLFVGGEFGNGVMLARDPQTGVWGNPVFVDFYGGSLGVQIGAKSSDLVFTVMNETAAERIMTEGFKLGAEAGIAIGQLGVGQGASTTTNFGEDVYAFARSQGLYGGLNFEGAYLRGRNDWNTAYYGQEVAAATIAHEPPKPLPASDAIRATLYGFDQLATTTAAAS